MSATIPLSPHLEHVLVTGATGLVGNNVARVLVRRGARVRVLVRDPQATRPFAGLDVEFATGDVTEPGSVSAALERIRSVVHAAGYVGLGWHHADVHESVNHAGARHVAQAARAAGIRLVHVSTINALGHGTPQRLADEEWVAGPNVACPYVVSKQAAERCVREEIAHGLDAVIVHPSLMFGPWDWKPSSGRMFVEVVRRFTPLAPAGGISVCDVRDVAQAIVAALAQAPAGRSYVLAGHNLTYLRLWQHFADMAHARRPLARCGPLLRKAAGAAGDLWGRLTGLEPDMNSAAIRLSDQYHYFSSARAHRELGYQIRPLEETLRDTWQWLRAEGLV
jgi:dihydroflavonol-4-reductase